MRRIDAVASVHRPRKAISRTRALPNCLRSNLGALAAPTAGLHFTPEILSEIPHAFVTLHVGPGTFGRSTRKMSPNIECTPIVFNFRGGGRED